MEKLKQNVVAWLVLAAFVGFAIGMVLGDMQGDRREQFEKCEKDLDRCQFGNYLLEKEYDRLLAKYVRCSKQ